MTQELLGLLKEQYYIILLAFPGEERHYEIEDLVYRVSRTEPGSDTRVTGPSEETVLYYTASIPWGGEALRDRGSRFIG